MFEKLDLTKEMLFKSKPAMTYEDALLELTEELGLPVGLVDPLRIEADLNDALHKEAFYLATGKNYNDDAHQFLVKFHRWAMNIHNNDLNSLPGKFPVNIIFDMKGLVLENPSKENALLRFIFEGFNGRKICDGNTPDGSFISTSMMLEVLSLFPKPLTEAARDFLAKFDSVVAFTDAQRSLVNGVTKLSEGNFYKHLSNDVVDDQRQNRLMKLLKEENKTTGANIYNSKELFERCMKRLENYPADKQAADLEVMVNNVQSVLSAFLQQFKAAKSTPQARNLGLWDASEWICRCIVTLEVAAAKDPKYKAVLDAIMADPVISECHERNSTGNYMAKERAEALEKVELAQIYLQHDIAAQARKQVALKA